jgi:hypothetical protein
MTLSGKMAPTNILLFAAMVDVVMVRGALNFKRDLFSIVAKIRPNYQIRSLLGKERIANFNHFLKNPLCEVV